MTYEYECQACKHTWEVEQKITDKPIVECPKCHEPEARRLIAGAPAHILKGTGWFKTGGY